MTEDGYTVAPEDTPPREPPKLIGDVPLDGELAERLLKAVAWYAHGDREASECSVYAYDQDIEVTHVGLAVSVERFDDSEYGQGYMYTMRPTVEPNNLPITDLEDELIEEDEGEN